MSDSFLVAMILKGLPNEYTPFVAAITKQDAVKAFYKFKQSLGNFEETEKTKGGTI